MHLHRHSTHGLRGTWIRVAVAGLWLGLGAFEGHAQTGNRTGELELRNQELELALKQAEARIRDLEGGAAGQATAEALAEANRAAETFRERYRELLLRVEALGLDSVESERALQERLIKAVRERQEWVEAHQEALNQLTALNEAILEFLKSATSIDVDARLRVEAEMRRSEELLGGASAPKAQSEIALNLDQGRVIGLKEEYRLAVLNLGRHAGAKPGMPVNILRGNELVATAIVVDVRDRMSGALIQEIYRSGDQVRVADHVQARADAGVNF